jgi:hypothetical protein
MGTANGALPKTYLTNKGPTMKNALSLFALIAAFPAVAEETRQLDAHEHGVGTLNIAIDGAEVAMEFHAPGADIVGFEYEASGAADLTAIETALAALNAPLELFAMSSAAGCVVNNARAELETEGEHEDHDDHDDHEDDDDHEDHEEHEDHDDHEDHDAHAHDEDHEDHGDDAGHTEFHAEYALSCSSADALSEITFRYFDAFPNAEEVEVQLVTSNGAQAFEVTRATPVLDLDR